MTEYSFFYEDGRPVVGAIINPNDHSGEDFLNNEIIASNPSLAKYMPNAIGGKYYDFKTRGIDKIPKAKREQYMYRGMPLNNTLGIGKRKSGITVYGSARDVGNIAAGYVAGRAGLTWEQARLGFDSLESWQHFRDNFPTLPEWKKEGRPSQQAQWVGWLNGTLQWMNNFLQNNY